MNGIYLASKRTQRQWYQHPWMKKLEKKRNVSLTACAGKDTDPLLSHLRTPQSVPRSFIFMFPENILGPSQTSQCRRNSARSNGPKVTQKARRGEYQDKRMSSQFTLGAPQQFDLRPVWTRMSLFNQFPQNEAREIHK